MGERRKRRLGDRRDGRRLRKLDPYNALTPFIMKTKSDASNYFSDSFEITEAERYLRSKRISGFPGLGMLHLFTAAYVRTVCEYPGVNRFISGQRVFARNNIELVMTIKRSMSVEAGETSIKVVFDPRDTVSEVYSKINSEVEKIKNGDVTDTDDVAGAFMKLPRLFLKFAVFTLNVLDYFGKIPKSIVKASPFHGSVIITDVGSIGLPGLFHHLYNFGNMPIFIAFGTKRKATELSRDGSPVERKYIDFTLVLDERICDGFYFSQAYKLFRSLLRNPKLMEAPPERVVEDVD